MFFLPAGGWFCAYICIYVLETSPVQQHAADVSVGLEGAAQERCPGVVQSLSLHVDRGRPVVVVLDEPESIRDARRLAPTSSLRKQRSDDKQVCQANVLLFSTTKAGTVGGPL